MQLPLDQARKYSEKIVAEIAPFCVPGRVAIAGSIRRCRPVVNDIDIVVIAKDWAGLRARCLQKSKNITHGDSQFSFETPIGVQVDIFRARERHRDLVADVPGTWGTILLCRTGSKEHNVHICERAHSLRLKWSPYAGVVDSRLNIIASETEEDIFKALQLDFISPERRER